MVQFTRLRLSGFKSFVEPTELIIEPGLTGVVGPNGCGKSNLVEALRWVMGEISAKRVRGGEMDDVIFSGSRDRPARNLAEVSVLLDNSQRRAPAAYNDQEEIEIVRRIERGEGSNYRINGRDARAHDVQLLFADLATGPRSTALVSQGRIGALINARPVDRRALLEEAAGITGLHSRRHEAELRLRAAETNLERLDDVVITLEDQLKSVRRQARQATRYRNLSDHIRRAEGIVLHLRWTEATTARQEAAGMLRKADGRVGECAATAAAKATAQAEAASDLPPLREAEAAAAAQLHRLGVERDMLSDEERRVREATEAARTRLEQIDRDAERERALGADATAALERLAAEEAELAGAGEGEASVAAEAATRLAETGEAVAALEGEVESLTRQVAAAEERRGSLDRIAAELEQRHARLERRAEEVAAEQAGLAGDTVDPAALDVADRAAAAAAARLETDRAEAEAAEQARQAAQNAENEAREALQTAAAERARLAAEAAALEELLAAGESRDWPPLVDSVTAETGYEAALAAALGDDLIAADDDAAPIHWRALPPLASQSPLPTGTEPLARYVQAPAVLARRLGQVGVVADEAAGRALVERLAQGQRLVSRSGALWRWDGFTVAAGTTTAAATRLNQRNRLTTLAGDVDRAERSETEARARAEDARTASRAAAESEKAARETARDALAALESAREAHAALARRLAIQESRTGALLETAERLRADTTEASAALEEARAARTALPETESERTRLDALRADLAARRDALRAAQTAHDRLEREGEVRVRRLEVIAAEQRSWSGRLEDARRQLGELEDRRAGAAENLEALATRPDEIAAQRNTLMDRITEAEVRRGDAADRLSEAETSQAEADRALKAAEAALATAREDRVRAEAAVTRAEERLQVIAERIAERLNSRPEQVLDAAGIKPDAALPDLAAVEARLERLLRERDNMGPVNLRAEQEARELEEKIATLQSERQDLVAAIARLRQGIGELNREGRQRLLDSFGEVNRHFEALFARLFGGGRAHLQLTDPDNPLEAGLEIMASPPGKRLQVLTLLSGGEQALTALALLFAVFLTNPAPVCVLDEVDAPLDDANVDRFCTLLEEIAGESETRFLLVTHHRMTMARMDRLFGVTMTERGVGQLVSVDLQTAETLRQTA